MTTEILKLVDRVSDELRGLRAAVVSNADDLSAVQQARLIVQLDELREEVMMVAMDAEGIETNDDRPEY